MKRFATTLSLFLAALALSVAPTLSFAVESEPAENAGDLNIDYVTQSTSTLPSAVQTLSVVYDNSTAASATLLAFSSTDLASTWGDELFTTAQGTLSNFIFSVYNSGSSLGPLLTANCAISFFDGTTFAPLGGFTTNVNFGTGLNAGFFSTITVSSLDVLGILLTNTDIIVTQQVLSKTGTANRLGFVSRNAPTVGSSTTSFFASSATVGGGVAGWYTSASGPVNAIYRVTVADLPVPAKTSSWGRIKSLYR